MMTQVWISGAQPSGQVEASQIGLETIESLIQSENESMTHGIPVKETALSFPSCARPDLKTASFSTLTHRISSKLSALVKFSQYDPSFRARNGHSLSFTPRNLLTRCGLSESIFSAPVEIPAGQKLRHVHVRSGLVRTRASNASSEMVLDGAQNSKWRDF